MKKSSDMSHVAEYRREYLRLREFGGSASEINIRGAFAKCLDAYCRERNLALILELESDKGTRPDGTVRDKMRLDYGHWEAKDAADNLEHQIAKKRARGYPGDNILYENGKTAILIRNDEEVLRVQMDSDAAIDAIIRNFLSYCPPEIADFHKAIKQFHADLPNILQTLRAMIEKAYRDNPDFIDRAAAFLLVCRKTINAEVETADVREMLIQHILTRDIFWRVFDEEKFHSQNNIARHLETLQDAFMSREARMKMLSGIKHYYAAIVRAAQNIGGHREKQNFLKALYENFYRAYNPAAADRLGVIYTPDEIVRFMVRMADELTHHCFARRLYDDNVHILDPATGTGTFITELVDFFPKKHLAKKYKEELYANEIGILPYYIANLNIEHAYMSKMGEYEEFPGICFVDTLDNMDFDGGVGQGGFFGAWSAENVERIKRQNKRDISVIIGNPPYNANQKNANENNENRKYPDVDARIKETYVAASTAQKTKLYDMYARFIRWSSDRLGDKGILAFVTNSSFIHAKGYDGFRKVVAEEFNALYVFDMKGASRGGTNEQTMRQGENVFGVRVGIAIWFFVKQKKKIGSDIFYCEIPDYMSAADKLAFLMQTKTLDMDNFFHIIPDENNNWINQTDNNFHELMLLADKRTKIVNHGDSSSVFKLFSLGAVSNRDDWVYDMDKNNLIKKVKFLINHYENARAIWGGQNGINPVELGTDIKWTRDLKKQLAENIKNKYSPSHIRDVLYRPFFGKKMYYHQSLNEMLFQIPHIFPSGKLNENKIICFNTNNENFYVLAADKTVDLHFTGDSQCLPLYRYTEDHRKISNINPASVDKFKSYYGDNKISAEDIFHYTYAVLHHPAYRQKYRHNLTREFPRLPFYADFRQWALWGKKLMHLHINFADIKPHKLRRVDDNAVKYPLVKLKADKAAGAIVMDTKTSLLDIPPEAWDYQLGNYSALEWVLNQHREKKIRDATVSAKFNAYRFADYKESAIELLAKVTAVSVETIKIIKAMESIEK